MKLVKVLLRKRRNKESLFKYWTALLHLWLGLLSSLVVMLVCLTGCIYAFKTQIIEMYNYNQVFVQPKSKTLPLDFFQQKFNQQNQQINTIILPKRVNKSIIISHIDNINSELKTQYFNPYTGENLGVTNGDLDTFFSTVLDLHKNLLLGEVGKQIIGFFVLIFIFLLLSGLILWWPKRKKRAIKNAFTIKWKAKFYRLNYDLHNTLGFYSLLLLLFIAITGVYITYPWMKSAILVSLGGESIAEQIQSPSSNEMSDSFANLMDEMLQKENEKSDLADVKLLSVDSLITLTNKQLPYKATTLIQFPDEEQARYQIQKINTQNFLGAMLPDKIEFNKKGELKKVELFKNKPLAKQFTEISKSLHTGEIMGVPSISIYFLVTLIGLILPITGFIIWWKKVK